MGITAAQLLVKVNADTAAAEKGIGGVSGLLGKALPLAALGGVAAVAGIGLASIKMAGDFQQGMTTLVTGAGEAAGDKGIGLVSKGILKMAVDTGTSTQQLTAGMFMIESAGFHGASGLAVLTAAAQGAKVGQADLGVTSDALTTILKDYPNVANGASGAMNTLIATVASGKTHMADLAGAMSQILPTSSAAHVGLNDVMGAMATMTGEGVPAANAATYLRQTILVLDAPSKQAEKALKSVGLSSAEVASEMQKSLPDALKMITDAVGKKFPIGSAAYVAAIKDISGGSKTMQGMLDLTGDHMKDFQLNVGNVADQVKKGGSSIVGWSEVQKDFNFKVDRAREVVETFMIKLGTGLLPIAGKVVDLFSADFVPTLMAVFNGFMTVITGGEQFIAFLQGTGPAVDAVKVALLALGGAMVGLGVRAVVNMIPAIIQSVTAFGAQAVAAATAAGATLLAMAPYVLIGAAIGAVVGGIILLVTHWNQVSAVMSGVVHAALGVVGSGIQAVIGWINQWKPLILTVAGILATIFGPTLITLGAQAVASGAQIAASFITQLVASGAAAVAQGARMTASFGAAMIENGVQAVRTGAQMTASLIPALISTSAQFAKTAIEGVASGTASLVSFAAQGYRAAGALLASVLPAVVSTTVGFVSMAATAIAGAIAGFIAYIPVAFTAAAATLAVTWPVLAVIAAIAAVIGIIVLAITHWRQITQVIGAFGTVLGNIGHAIASFATQALAKIVEFVQGVAAFFGGLVGKVLSAIGDLANAVLTGLGSLKDKGLMTVATFVINFVVWYESLPSKAASALGSLLNTVLSALGNLGSRALSAVGSFIGGIVGYFFGLPGRTVGALGNLASTVLNSLGSLKDRAIAWAGGFVSGIIGALASLPGKFLALGGQIIQQLASGITGAYGTIKNAISNIPVVGGAVGLIGNFIPHFASGGVMAGAGIAVVGEEGPELVQLPGGAKVTPLAGAQGNSGLPAGMSAAYGLATGSANGHVVQLNVYLDSYKFAQIMTKLQPSVIRNGTGARSF